MIGITGPLAFLRKVAALGRISAFSAVISGLASTWAVAVLTISLALAGDAAIGEPEAAGTRTAGELKA